MSSAYSVKASLATRYSLALLLLAEERNVLDKTEADLLQFQEMVKKSKELAFLLVCPTISRKDKTSTILAIAEKAGFEATTRDFLATVANNNRLFALPEMITAFFNVIDERKGIVNVDVISAIELTEAQQKEITDSLLPVLGKQSVRLSLKVNKDLLGGMMVRIGSLLIDSSLKTKVQQLKTVMKGA